MDDWFCRVRLEYYISTLKTNEMPVFAFLLRVYSRLNPSSHLPLTGQAEQLQKDYD